VTNLGNGSGYSKLLAAFQLCDVDCDVTRRETQCGSLCYAVGRRKKNAGIFLRKHLSSESYVAVRNPLSTGVAGRLDNSHAGGHRFELSRPPFKFLLFKTIRFSIAASTCRFVPMFVPFACMIVSVHDHTRFTKVLILLLRSVREYTWDTRKSVCRRIYSLLPLAARPPVQSLGPQRHRAQGLHRPGPHNENKH